MSTPLRMTQTQIDKFIALLSDKLGGLKFIDGELSLTQKLVELDKKTNVVFSPQAFAKMQSLIHNFDSEVAWHGISTRSDDGFVITDIIVYPQEVTGGTVNTDQEAYERWLMGLDDGVFNNLRMQGHSHVNMSTSPSSVDISHQERIVEQLDGEDYYIFMIWNKKMQVTCKIYDMADNIVYENKDVQLYVGDLPLNGGDFITDAKALVKTKGHTYTKSKGYTYTKSKGYTHTKSKDNPSRTNKVWDEDDFDYEGYYGGYYGEF